MPHRPIYLWEITVNNSFTAVESSWDSSPRPVNGRRAHQAAGTAGPVARGRDIRYDYEGWVTSCGVCGHLLDSPSALSPSGTSLKPEQARFGWILLDIIFFRQDSLKSEGRCHADPRINTRPACDHTPCTKEREARGVGLARRPEPVRFRSSAVTCVSLAHCHWKR